MNDKRLGKLEKRAVDLIPREEIEHAFAELGEIIADAVHDKADQARVLAAVEKRMELEGIRADDTR